MRIARRVGSVVALVMRGPTAGAAIAAHLSQLKSNVQIDGRCFTVTPAQQLARVLSMVCIAVSCQPARLLMLPTSMPLRRANQTSA